MNAVGKFPVVVYVPQQPLVVVRVPQEEFPYYRETKFRTYGLDHPYVPGYEEGEADE
jgi:hypothetical protein